MNHDDLYAQAMELYSRREFIQAEKILHDLYSSDPANGTFSFGIASCLQSLNRCEEALPFYIQAYQHNPVEVIFLSRIISCLLTLNYKESADYALGHLMDQFGNNQPVDARAFVEGLTGIVEKEQDSQSYFLKVNKENTYVRRII